METYAMSCRTVADIECLVEKIGADSLSTRDEWGYTPAHWAALDGNVEVSHLYSLIFVRTLLN